MPKIKLQKGLYEGKELGYSQLFGENPQDYAKFGLKGHNGIDIPVSTGTKLTSCINGTVTETLNDTTGYGIYVKIENEYCGVLYAHLKDFSLKVGDKVKAGDFVGFSGNTGNSTGSHLHFGVFPIPRNRDNGYAGYIDPFGDQIEWVNKLQDNSCETKLKIKDLEIDELKNSRNRWKEECKFKEEEALNAIKRIKDLEKQLAEAVSNNKHLTDGNLTYANENSLLKTKLEALEIKLEEDVKEIKELNNQIKQLKEKLSKGLNGYTVKQLLFAIFRRWI